ncbi:SUI1 family translation initiation factor [Porphyromonas macacae]|uniref:translation initiation factor n=1 Tax=Porphyromonas macacae TaxID=28115 RepID=UPI00052BD153|nr:translation initiation factor [Porphyromonas macacae]KGN99691.1 SUI1 family translation initiation factor [Porphyromonas macacae]
MADWKKRLGVLYSTDPNYRYTGEEIGKEELLPPAEQQLRITLDKKNRSGKEVSLVSGFVGPDEDLKDLAKELKHKCGVGGSVKDGAVIIQGDKREQILKILSDMGYKKARKY